MNTLQYIERGITTAEIIHPDFKAQCLETLYLFLDEVQVVAYSAFSNLDRQLIMGETGLIDPSANFLNNVTDVKIIA